MAVVGGSLVVTAAALTVLGILDSTDLLRNTNDQNDDEKDAEALSRQYPNELLLPLPPTTSPVIRPSTTPSSSTAPSQSPSISTAPSEQPSSRPTATGRPSSMPSVSPSITSNPTDHPSSLPSVIPSGTPSMRPSNLPTVSSEPTHYPTTSPTKSPSVRPTNKPTDLIFSISSTGTFGLRLHWEPGFMWQESPDEAFFCMACAWCDDNIFDEHCDIQSFCEENMSLALVNCHPNKRNSSKRRMEITTFTLGKRSSGLFGVGNSFAGDQIQVYGTNLCLHRIGTRAIFLQQCDAASAEQRFLGFRSGGQAMELLPEGSFKKNGIEFDRCLTQHHHPRQGERIYADECRKARNSDTNLWSTF
ncbi:hypothetical protein ACHAXR_009605 [Thalassiosira sp. AJA248-18]